MIKARTRMLALAAAAGLICGAQSSQAANLNLCGGSPGGLWSLLGAGLDSAAKAADPNTTITYQTSSGGYANVVEKLLMAGANPNIGTQQDESPLWLAEDNFGLDDVAVILRRFGAQKNVATDA